MADFSDLEYPQIPILPTHYAGIKTIFFPPDKDGYAPTSIPNANNIFDPRLQFIDQGGQFIVLEEAVGYSGEWAKINFQGNIGYIDYKAILPLPSTKPSIRMNLSSEYLPNIISIDIDWKEQPVDEIFYDQKNAKWCISLDTGVEIVGDRGNNSENKNKILETIKTSLYVGTKLILRDTGRRFDAAYVKQLIEKYYLFSKAEKYYFPLRPCSTMRVLVTIPARYIFSAEIELNPIPLFRPDILDSAIPKNKLDINGFYDPDKTSISGSAGDSGTVAYIKIDYDSYADFSLHIDRIIFDLRAYQAIQAANRWIVEPSGVSLNLFKESLEVEEFRDAVEKFLMRNGALEQTTFWSNQTEAQNAVGFAKNYLDKVAGSLFGDKTLGGGNVTNSDGIKLRFYISPPELLKLEAIKIIRIINGQEQEIPLNFELYKFVNSQPVKNRTTLHYLDKIERKSALDTLKERAAAPIIEIGKGLASLGTGIIFPPLAIAFVPVGYGVWAAAQSVGQTLENAFKFEQTQQTIDYFTEAGKGINDTIGSALDESSKIIEELNPVTNYKKFILANHFPKITSVEALPIDLADCTINNLKSIQDIKNTKIKEWIKDFEENKKFEAKIQKAREGGIFLSAVETDVKLIENKSLRLLLNLEKQTPEPKKTWVDKLQLVLSSLSALDWQRFLAEALKCQAFSFDPQLYLEILNNYQKIRRQIENVAAATVCNPFLTKLLKDIESFQIPKLRIRNRNEALLEQLRDHFVKVLNDILVIGIRAALNAAFNNCLKDKNPNFNNNGDIFNNALDNASDDPAIDDLLSDVFGNLKDNGIINPAAKEAAKEKLKELLSDIVPCLTSLEICRLLNGKPVNNEVFEVLISLIKRKNYSIIIDNISINPKDYLNSNASIVEFFSKLGAILNIADCEDVLNALPVPPANPLCDDGSLNKLRCELLKGKGLPADEVDRLLTDIKDQERKNLEDLLNFLDNSDKFPYDIEKIPSILCKNGQKPLVSLAPPIDSFAQVLDTNFGDIYRTFDNEALSWYTTTYSLSGSLVPSFLNIENGSIIAKTGSNFPDTADFNLTGSKHLLPSFLFVKSIEENKTNLAFNNSTATITYNIDSEEQQKLDIQILESRLNQQIENVEEELGRFLATFLQAVTLYGTNQVLNAIASTKSGKKNVSSGDAYDVFINGLSGFANNDFGRFLGMCDAFGRGTGLTAETAKVNFFDNIPSAEANALFLANEGMPVLVSVMEYIIANKSSFVTLLNKISSVNLSGLRNIINANSDIKFDFTTSTRATDAFNDFYGPSNKVIPLKDFLENLIIQYNNIKNQYIIYKRTKVLYPDYNLSFTLGLNEIKVDDTFTVKNSSPNALYDLYDFKITKNQKKYLQLRSGHRIDDEAYNYIKNNLPVSPSNIDKLSVFRALTKTGTSTQFQQINTDIFEKIRKQISGSLFLQMKDSAPPLPAGAEDDSEIKLNAVQRFVPYTKQFSDALVLQPTPLEKACGITRHYLEIDELKDQMIKAKASSSCGLEEVRDERLATNKPVNAKELEDLNLNETQNIMLGGTYRLGARVFLHDIMLRGANAFAIFDPQTLRNDSMFLEFMSDIVESEIRGMDNTYFRLMMTYIKKNYEFTSKTAIPKESEKLFTRLLYREFIKAELQTSVLPKMTKRLHIDTNNNLKKVDEKLKLELEDIYDFFAKEENGIIKYVGPSVTLSGLTVFNSQRGNTGESLKNEFRGSPQFKVIFEYLFPITKYLTYFFIQNVLCNSTRKQIVNAFRDTKKSVIGTAKLIQTNGEGYIADPDNIQDMMNENSSDFFLKFLLEAAIKTPISIFKGYVEATEPNITLSTVIYQVTKAILPPTPSFLVPAISIPAFFLGIPFINPLFGWLYLGTFLWYEGDSDNEEAKKYDAMNQFLNGQSSNCLVLKSDNPDFNRDATKLEEILPLEGKRYQLKEDKT
jgi:hypothetical protein